MSPARVEIMRLNRLLEPSDQVVLGREKFEVGKITAKIDGRSEGATVVKFSGGDLRLFQIEDGQITMSGEFDNGEMEVKIHRGESLQIQDNLFNAIKVTHGEYHGNEEAGGIFDRFEVGSNLTEEGRRELAELTHGGQT